MGKSQRKKGHSYERKIAAEMREFGFKDARRHLEYQDGEANGIDIVGTDPFAIQCKAHKDYVPVSTLKEIQNQSWQIPVVFTKGDRKKEAVIMYKEDFYELLESMRASGIL